jgi:small RNA 2'-O-methyltransferase
VDRRERRTRRRAAADRWERLETGVDPVVLGHDETGTPLHEARLDAVVRAIVESGARTVLDLGCGAGALLRRLALEPRLTRIVGVDTSLSALRTAERSLAALAPGGDSRIVLQHGSFETPDEHLRGFDAAAMVETIEHVDPAHLSRVERAVFAELRPALVVLTTPNREYNVHYGLAAGELRHPDHRFEWDRAKFAAWSSGVAARHGYRASHEPIGPSDPLLGSPTQMAVFTR